MAIATTGKSKTKRRSVGRPPAASLRSGVKTAPQKRAVIAKTASASPASSKEELRARVEKLERANATLRVKNKELRLAYVEASETIDTLTLRLQGIERKAERQARADAPNEAATPRRGRRSAAAMAAADADAGSETVGAEADEEIDA